MRNHPDYVFCGDDFTGASDTLATLSRAGLRSRLFLSSTAVQKCQTLSDFDAIGIATATRSMKPEKIRAELSEIGQTLAALDAKIFHYKICSTFDSSPKTGSIGAGVDTLRQLLPNSGVVVIGGQPSLGRYCAFSNLFAAAIDQRLYRIDSHPTMANHPVTPMSEADLRLLLESQGIDSVHGIHLPEYTEDIDSIQGTVRNFMVGNRVVLFDVLHQSDLSIIGKILNELPLPRLVVGASSVAEAYIAGFVTQGTDAPPYITYKPEKPVFLLAGSRSQATELQVQEAKGFSQLLIDPAEIEQDSDATLVKLSTASINLLDKGCNVMAIVSSDMQHSLTRVELAQFTADLTACIAFSGSIGRLGIAGGDTSSLALQSLGVESLSYVTDIEPGICLCRLHSLTKPAIDGLEVVLKGGQMGSPHLFTKLTGLL